MQHLTIFITTLQISPNTVITSRKQMHLTEREKLSPLKKSMNTLETILQ